jgi:putative CocE/NonD family hydrolase
MDCADGVRLATRIWQPPEGTGPWPALLMRQPYGRAIASTVTYAHPRWYAARGFLVVVQDVRGRGSSEGVFGGFAQESADGAAAMRWLRKLPQCNGRIGCYGFSYQGLSQLLVAADGQQAGPCDLPDALAPAMCGLDERRHWASEGGAHWWALSLGWGLQLACEGCRRQGDADGWREIRRSLEGGSWLRDGVELLERHDPGGMVRQWLALDPAESDGWRRHQPPQALLRRPLLLIGGWHDPHLRGALDLWRRSREAGGRPQLCIGAWSHLHWRGGVDERQLAFFRRHLIDAPASDNGIPTEPLAIESNGSAVQLECSNGSGWRELTPAALESQPEPLGAACWTLRSAGLAAVRSDEGELLPAPARGEGRVWLVHDPWRPVPGRGGHLGLESGCVDRADIDARADVACFTAAPLQQPLELLGEPLLDLFACADQPGFDLCAALSMVDPAGSTVRQLCTGVLRQRGEPCRREVLRRVRLQPLRARLQPGERLRLSLAAAAWPQIAVNPGDGSLPTGAVGPEHRVIELQLRLDRSRLWLTALIGADCAG